MKKFCKVTFVFTPELKDEVLKDELVSEFVDVRNGVSEILNQNYELWNAEYDSLIPDDDIYEKDINGLSLPYRNFICEKQNSVLNNYLTSMSTTRMRYFYDLEDLDFKGKYIDKSKNINTKVEAFLELL